jgi:hypothetical protein
MPSSARQGFLWSDEVREMALTIMLIVQCLIIFVAAPSATMGFSGSRVVLELLLFSFGFLVIVISRGLVATALATLAMVMSFLDTIYNLFASPTSFSLVAQIGTIIGSIVVGFVVGQAVLAAGKVTVYRIIGAIVLYLNFGLVFTAAYRAIWDINPHSLNGILDGTDSLHAAGTILYFSFVTLTTLGYGEIVPVHPLARSLATLEGIIGQLYPATLLARLITLELETRRH